ncbi:PKD domain-containing protein [Arthrobacter sp. ERGS1:01]|uniref:PKD domain-containing protein n=1 Tax=Arthrobacter sp. ERGS1:01 TaxID=1704044 RepID=UPI0006B54DAE|nr:PKD domain-containing protein [Arthrobacter sp. ERGS1:01]
MVGGSFTTLDGSANPGYGMGMVDATTGALLPMAANNLVRDGGSAAAILALASSGNQVYGSGYVFGAGGNLEGSFSANWSDGAITWLEDCHGDTYSVYPGATAVYVAGHPHLCSTIGGFPQTEPTWTFHRGLAFSKAATGVVGTNTEPGYFNFAGAPAPSLLNWFPDMDEGTFTGEYQGPWTVQGNSQYVVYGGEFLHVNGVAQQGLVRYAVPAIAPNLQGPMITGSAFNPTIKSFSAGTARILWTQNWDRDNVAIRYDVIRDGDTGHPIYTTTANSTFWMMGQMSFTDTGLVPGSTHTYRVFATDPFGNVARSDSVSVTTALTGTLSPYATQVVNDGVGNYWRLGEASGTTAADLTGGNNIKLGTGVTRNVAGAINGDTDKASTFSGTSSGSGYSTGVAIAGPNVFTMSAWVKTTSTRGGKILGFGSSTTGNSSSYDRQLYMDNAGHIIFGVYNGTPSTLASTAKYNDGAWHMVTASLGPNGMALYVDGVSLSTRTDVTAGQSYSGYWRIGGDNLGSWPSPPTSNYIAATIDEAAIFPTVLTPQSVTNEYNLGKTGVGNQPPVAAFTATPANLAVAFDGGASTDPDGTIAAYSWNYGDGTAAGTGKTSSHTYAAAGTYQVTLTVSDNLGSTGVLTKAVTVAGPNQPPVAAFTATPTNLAVAFDGGTSTDPDGTVASYSWNFGDGSPAATGKTVSYTYAAAGSYQVTLTVTDNLGATNSLTKTVTVNAPPPANIVAQDLFARTVANNWGTADVGGAWSIDSGNMNQYSVSNGTAKMINLPGQQPNANLTSVTSTSTDLTLSFSLNNLPGGGGMYLSVQGRSVDNVGDYRAKLAITPSGALSATISRYIGSTETILTSANLPFTYTAGTKVDVELQVNGTSPTTISAKFWPDGTTAPATWNLTTTDSTASLQVGGGVGMLSYLSAGAAANTTVSYQNLVATIVQ